MCTYLNEQEKNLPISNDVVKETLDSLRKVTGESWVVHERKFTTGSWWWKKEHKRYELLLDVSQGTEYQIINFYREGAEISHNPMVTADVVVAYMYAQIDGYRAGRLAASHEHEMHVRSIN